VARRGSKQGITQQNIGEDHMAAGTLEARLSNIEELMIIIIIIIYGGGRGGGHGPGIPDPAATDLTRIESLLRVVRPPRGDPFVTDVARLPLEAIEARLLEVSAELTRLRSHEGELNARLKELRGNKTK
jgi:hypothetical protein